MLLFTQAPGGAMGFDAYDGVKTGSLIEFGVDDMQDAMAGGWEAFTQGVEDTLIEGWKWAGGPTAVNTVTKGAQILYNTAWETTKDLVLGTLIGGPAGAGVNAAAGVGDTVKEARAILNSRGSKDAVKAQTYAKGGLGFAGSSRRAQNMSYRSQQSLTYIIQPLGVVTGVSLDCEDPVNVIGIAVESGAPRQLYQATISGIAFQRSCEAGAEGLHGLEPLLEYFYHHRVSNTDKNLTKTTLRIGKTVLRGWVYGFTADPLNLDFMVWKWTLKLYISPVYRPNVQDTMPDNYNFTTRRTAGVGEQ